MKMLCTILALCSIITSAMGQPDALSVRLEALNPADADGYLRLAEELIDEASSPDQIRLGRQLLVLAMQIGIESSDQLQRAHARSAALALASIASTESERRWVLSMAPRDRPAESNAQTTLGSLPRMRWELATGLLAAEAMGLARSGEGRLALRRLDEPGVRQVLSQVTPLLGISGAGGAAGQVERTARGWPCPQCVNQRIIRTRDGAGGVEIVRCPTCLANPGSREMTARELTLQLRAELRLLGGNLRAWSAQTELDGGAPLREPTATGLERFYRVDLRARIWRDGGWVRPEPEQTPDRPSEDPPQQDAPPANTPSGDASS